MPIISEYFSRGRSRRQGQLDVKNPVLVNVADNEYCLGYLQDVDGDNLFVDFDCTTLPPWWFPAGRVWFYNLNQGYYPTDKEILVAVRNEPTGPYIFRPAIVVWYYCDLFLCRLIRKPVDSETTSLHFVHRWQTAYWDGGSVMKRSSKLDVEKVVICLKTTEITDEIDGFNIAEDLKACYPGSDTVSPRFVDRIFVRNKENEIVFLIVIGGGIYDATPYYLFARPCCKIHSRGPVTAGKVVASVRKYLHLRSNKPEFPRIMPASDRTECPFTFLPTEITKETLLYLDVHSQAVTKRVCALWNILMSDVDSSVFATIDFSRKGMSPFHRATTSYHYGFVLNHAVSRDTKVLSLLKLSQRVNNNESMAALMEITSTVLTMNNAHLSVLLVKHWEVTVNRPPGVKFESTDFFDFQTSERHYPILPLQLKKFCRQLVFSQFVVDFDMHFDKKTFPKYAKHRMPGFAQASTLSSLRIEIPNVRFAGEDSFDDSTDRFTRTLDDCCPTTDWFTKEQLWRLHAAWVHTVPYPGKKWVVFMQHLEYYGIRQHVGSSVWRDLDLREFDNLPFSKLSLAILTRDYLHP
ncbi:uncharacterized protein LOC129598794 [Paramacrobiotus metropolitanus]|uniref:uncharacterized protein LOC129598794 n=1 Tax=Paramacrobiotus metropolitanus TaxID=2943436 RepID=UPI0024457439|nr:uncharacterized protein LOC129598794 [Paramacrobiotus metropolitanus]